MTTDDINATVERAKREILNDIRTGRVPETVSSFAELHDYLDANEYGGLTTRDDVAGTFEDYIEFGNTVQDILHQWLAAGRPSTPKAPDPVEQDKAYRRIGWSDELTHAAHMFPVAEYERVFREHIRLNALNIDPDRLDYAALAGFARTGLTPEDEPDETYDSDHAGHSALLLNLSVTATRRADTCRGIVHLGVSEVFIHEEPVAGYPAGIEDFAGMTARRFAKRLATLLADNTTDL
jgi:hypothetical protein